jgi:DNA-binding NtrC family response regulator
MPVILMTGFADDELRGDARRLGAAAVFDKPFDIDDLVTAAMHALRVAKGD